MVGCSITVVDKGSTSGLHRCTVTAMVWPKIGSSHTHAAGVQLNGILRFRRFLQRLQIGQTPLRIGYWIQSIFSILFWIDFFALIRIDFFKKSQIEWIDLFNWFFYWFFYWFLDWFLADMFWLYFCGFHDGLALAVYFPFCFFGCIYPCVVSMLLTATYFQVCLV